MSVTINSPLDNYSVIVSEIKTNLGWPLIELPITNYDEFIKLACRDFYISRPFIKMLQAQATWGTTILNLPAVVQQHWPTTYQQWVFLGLGRGDYLVSGQTLRDNIDFFLTGAQGTPFQYAWLFQPYNILPDLMIATSMDVELSQLHYEFDQAEQNIKITGPAEGLATLQCAYQFVGNGTTTFPWDMIPAHSLKLVAQMSAERVLRALVIAFSLGKFNADFQLDPTYLKDILDKLEAKNELELGRLAIPVVANG